MNMTQQKDSSNYRSLSCDCKTRSAASRNANFSFPGHKCTITYSSELCQSRHYT